MKHLFGFISTFSILLVSGFTNAQDNNGELLCFEKTNYDAGELYIRDWSQPCFVFVNCTEKAVVLENVVSSITNKEQPYRWMNKNKLDSIQPGESDTLWFYRSGRNTLPGLYDQRFIISFKNSPVRQYLNIFCELKNNSGHLIVAPVVLDTVKRGEVIDFYVRVTNTGQDPVTLQPAFQNQKQTVSCQNEFPFTVAPESSRVMNFKLKTKDLYNSYKGNVSFSSNEEYKGYQSRLQIGYSGTLISVNHPSIKFDSLVLTKFLLHGEPCIFHFGFVNDGDAPLLIPYAKTSCGCLVAEWPREPIMPGERGEIKVRYDSKRIGPINKSITVKTNVCSQPIVLRVKGNITKEN